MNNILSTTEVIVESSSENPDNRKITQKYQSKWEQREEFKYWLKPVKKDCYKAFCVACKAMLNSNIPTLKAHAKGKRHLKAISYLYDTSIYFDTQESSYSLCTGSNRKRLLKLDDNSSPKFKEIVIDCTSGPLNEKEIPIENISNSSQGTEKSLKKHRPQKYRSEWETYEEYNPWLRPVLDDCYRAYCLACQVTLKSELVCIKGHAKGLKHHKAKQVFTGEKDTLLNHPHLREFLDVNSDMQTNSRHKKLFNTRRNEGSTSDLKNLLIQISESDPLRLLQENGQEELDSSFGEDMLITKLVEIVSSNFCVDLESFLRKNYSILQSLKQNPELVEGDCGADRLTKMLVGYMAQSYLADYVLDSCKSDDCSSLNSLDSISNRLDSVENSLEHSVSEMKRIKTDLESEDLHRPSSIFSPGNFRGE